PPKPARPACAPGSGAPARVRCRSAVPTMIGRSQAYTLCMLSGSPLVCCAPFRRSAPVVTRNEGMAMSENRPQQPKQPAPRTAFKPGQSGNPGGRPRELKEVREAAREHTAEAIERLAHWMRSDDPRASPAAAQALLDRG